MGTRSATAGRRGASLAKKDSVPERFVRAVEAMEIAPHHRVLEIGCGAGLAITLIGEKLYHGRVLAIDRSEPMIALARRRNRELVSGGKAEFVAVALVDADFGRERFDKVFGFNVNAFWKDTKGDLEAIASVLAPRGRLYVFYEPPSKAQIASLKKRITARLEAGGFAIERTLVEDLMIAIVAKKAPAR